MGIYTVTKRMEIAGSHSLVLPYSSKCENLHGHNWIVEVTCQAEKLTKYGMVVDFTHIKKFVHDRFDHANLNDIFIQQQDEHGNIICGENPTAENFAKYILDAINIKLHEMRDEVGGDYPATTRCTKVVVQESEGNVASYQLESHR